MMKYEKPIIQINSEIAEGVYAASGALDCESEFMRGIWQDQDNSSWWVGNIEYKRGYKQQFGCHGCRAYTPTGCGLLGHKIESDNASSYDGDMGSRKPLWEQKGYGPDEIVEDWNC